MAKMGFTYASEHSRRTGSSDVPRRTERQIRSPG